MDSPKIYADMGAVRAEVERRLVVEDRVMDEDAMRTVMSACFRHGVTQLVEDYELRTLIRAHSRREDKASDDPLDGALARLEARRAARRAVDTPDDPPVILDLGDPEDGLDEGGSASVTVSIHMDDVETAHIDPYPGVAEWASTFDSDETVPRLSTATFPDVHLLNRVGHTIARLARDRSVIVRAAHGVDFGEGYDERMGDTDTRYGDLADPYAAIRRYATGQGVVIVDDDGDPFDYPDDQAVTR